MKQTALAQWPPPPADPDMWMIDSDELVEGQWWSGVHNGVGPIISHPMRRRPVWVAELLEVPEPPRPTVTVDLVDLSGFWPEARPYTPRAVADFLDGLLGTHRQAREALLEAKGGDSPKTCPRCKGKGVELTGAIGAPSCMACFGKGTLGGE